MPLLNSTTVCVAIGLVALVALGIAAPMPQDAPTSPPVAPASQEAVVFYAQGMDLFRLTLSDSSSRKIVTGDRATGGEIYYADVDCANKEVYWTDHGTNTIKRAGYDGSQVETVVSDPGFAPQGGFAVDYISGNIFWTLKEGSQKWIVVSKLGNMSAGYHKVVEDSTLTPRVESNGEWGSMAVHPGKGTIYWTSGAPKTIEAANMDGSNRRTLASDVHVFDMAVDNAGDELCWTDYRTGSYYDYKLKCVSLNGGTPRLVHSVGNSGTYIWGVAASADRIYWGDFTRKTINSISKAGSDHSQHVDGSANSDGHWGNVWGLAHAPAVCPVVPNGCAHDNGGCTHICLPQASGGKTCVE